jgi:hypothetical protein
MARFILGSGVGEGAVGPAGADGADGAQGEIGFPGFKYDTRRVLENQYLIGEIVEYQGEYFICIANNDALTPEVGDYWASYSFVGPQGESGADAEISEETSFTIAGGTLGTQPTFEGAPLFTGSYVKTGPMVHFRIDVDFDNITSFGTGQYYLDLPFPAKYNYEFVAGCLHDISETRDYPMTGHIYAGESRMLLKSLDASGNTAFAVPFTATAPVTLAVADNFHISGDYIADPEAP